MHCTALHYCTRPHAVASSLVSSTCNFSQRLSAISLCRLCHVQFPPLWSPSLAPSLSGPLPLTVPLPLSSLFLSPSTSITCSLVLKPSTCIN